MADRRNRRKGRRPGQRHHPRSHRRIAAIRPGASAQSVWTGGAEGGSRHSQRRHPGRQNPGTSSKRSPRRIGNGHRSGPGPSGMAV